jgi:hypothetical protein
LFSLQQLESLQNLYGPDKLTFLKFFS